MATLRQTFKDIADAIREKGVSGSFKPTEMASKIGEIQTGGWLPPPEIPDDVTGMDLTLYSCEDNNAYQFRSYNPNYSTTKPKVPASWDGGSDLTNVKILNAGEQIKIIRKNNDTTFRFGVATSNAVCLAPTGKTYVYGDFTKQHIELNPPDYCYAYYFYGNSHIDIPKRGGLICRAMSNSCYYQMFFNCKSLTTAPELPATNLASGCYDSMFNGCSSLTTAPELPATTLANYCYYQMFRKCTSLKRIKMNASSGSWGANMFNGCTSLELVDMTGSVGVPQLSHVNNFDNTNDTYKIVVPDSLYDTWITATNWVSIASHIMKQSDWNSAHPDDILG